MIEANNITKKFFKATTPILNNINIKISDGDFISIMGRSGSGKSTLLYILSTLDRTFDGNIFYDGVDTKLMNVQKIHELRNKDIGFVFQFHYLISELSALENILLPTRKTKQQKVKESFAMELLKEIGLTDKANELPNNLSGGEQQRIAIARALIMQPKYLFADEPTGNLDSANGKIILDLFEKFNSKYQTTIVYVTHDKEFGERAKTKIQLH
jgi:ABC-type lipoprotein export system ATPase subunit